MPTQKIDPKLIFASDAPTIDKPPVFGDKTKGWDVARANDGRPTIKEMNKVQQDTDLKILWLNENSVTPHDESIDYPDGAVAIKDGSFKQLASGAWVEFLDDFANKNEVKRGIANRYDSSLTYNSGERVVLTNGDIVKSTINNNTSNPNTDMTEWVKTNSAGQIFDESGKTQQEVNNILLKTNVVNFSSMWTSSTTINCRAALQAAVDLTPDGGVLIIPFDIYFEGTITCLNKNINIYNYGKIYWKPIGTDKAFTFSRDDYIDILATELSVLPKKGDYKLNFTTPPTQIAQPSDYFVNLISTENEIFRLQFNIYYTKNHTNSIATSDYQLRGEIVTDFNDASKLKLRFVKKGTPVKHYGLHIIPTVKLETGSLNYVEYLHTSNITRENWLVYSSGKQRSGQQVAYNHCYNINVESCHVYGANATDSDNYSEVQFNTAWLSFRNCGYYDADGTAKRSRGLAGRHGYMVKVDGCLWQGVDDHWGHEYTLKNMVLITGLGLSGGGAYLDNITAMTTLFSGRNDSPYNDGKLIVRNCKTYGKIINFQRVTTPSEFTRYKLFDIIDIECDVYTSKTSVTELITTTDASNLDESFHDTEAKFKLRVFQDSNKIVPFWSQGYSPMNPTLDGDRNEARLFKTLDIQIDHIIKDVGYYQTGRQMFYGICADEISLRVKGGLSCNQVRANKVTISDTDIGFNGSTVAGSIKANELHINASRINSYAQSFTHGTLTPKCYLRNNDSANWDKLASLVAWNLIDIAYSNSVKDASDRALISGYRNYHSYDKQKFARYTVATDIVLAANATSSTMTVNMVGYQSNDLIIAQQDIYDAYIAVEVFDNANTNGVINFRIKNLTSNSVTVAAGRAINFKVV